MIEIVKSWAGNPERAELFIFDGVHLVQVLAITEPYVNASKDWRTMTKPDVVAIDNLHLSDGVDFFTYYIKGETDDSIIDAITAPRA